MNDLPDNAVKITAEEFPVSAMEMAREHGPGQLAWVWLKDDPPPEPTLAEKAAETFQNEMFGSTPWDNLPSGFRKYHIAAMQAVFDVFDLVQRSDVHGAIQVNEDEIGSLRARNTQLRSERDERLTLEESSRLAQMIDDLRLKAAQLRPLNDTAVAEWMRNAPFRNVEDHAAALCNDFGNPPMPTQEQLSKIAWPHGGKSNYFTPDQRKQLVELGIMPADQEQSDG